MDDKKNEAEAGRGSMSQRIKQPGVGVSPPKFGGEILRARKDAGLSLDELARRSGVSHSILSQLERDSTNPTIATLWRICSDLVRSPESLFRVGDYARLLISLLSAHATPATHIGDGLFRLRLPVSVVSSPRPPLPAFL